MIQVSYWVSPEFKYNYSWYDFILDYPLMLFYCIGILFALFNLCIMEEKMTKQKFCINIFKAIVFPILLTYLMVSGIFKSWMNLPDN